MKKLISKRLIVVYLLLVVAFRLLFARITRSMLIAPFDAIIDTRAAKFFKKPFNSAYLFDSDYVRSAKHGGYKIDHYLHYYLPTDTVFPFVYTLGFLSILQLLPTGAERFKKFMYVTVIAGFLFDESENFSFATYLKSDGESLASVVSFFTTLKTFFIIFNGLVCIAIVLFYLVYLIRHRTQAREVKG